MAIDHDVTIVVDNEDELDQIAQRLRERKPNQKAIWALRLRGFQFDTQKHKSRFGFRIDSVDSVLNRLQRKHADVAEKMRLSGLHFHLDVTIGDNVSARSSNVCV